MKYLSHYIEAKQTELFDKTGAFFAFSQAQFEEKIKEGIKYVSMGSGLICPKDKADELNEGLSRIAKEGMQEDLAENGRVGIIHRELGNHEYCITHDPTDTIEKLAPYGIIAEEIRAEAPKYLRAHYAWEEEQERKGEI